MNSSLPSAWQQCHDAFLQAAQERSGSVKSRDAYASILRLFFTDAGKPCDAYSRADVQAFLRSGSHGRYDAGRPVSVATRNGRLSCLTSFYRFASNYLVDGQPLFPGIAPTTGLYYLKPDVHYRAMSATELEKFFACIPDTLTGLRDRAFFATIFWTARRLSEVLRLRYGDMEPALIASESGPARPGILYRYTGKGHSREIKTKELPAPAHQAIETYLRRSGRLDCIQPNEPLFCAIYPGRGRKHRRRVALTHSYIEDQFHVYIRAAGLDDARHLTIHSLRHTAARLRRQSGSTLEQIKELLDHTSLQTTDRYLLVQAGEIDPGASMLERKFGALGATG